MYHSLAAFCLLSQSSNELKGQSTNKTISRNESLRCVNALLIPVSKFHPPAVCCPLMRNKTPRSGEGGWWNGSMLRLLHNRLTHTYSVSVASCAGCYSRTEACFQPCDSAGLIKEHISICSHSASARCLPSNARDALFLCCSLSSAEREKKAHRATDKHAFTKGHDPLGLLACLVT